MLGENMKVKIHPTADVESGAEIGAGTAIWRFSCVRSGAVIGAQCNLGQNVYIDQDVRIGSFVKIQNNVSVYHGVELEDYVFCGPSAVFTNVLNPRSMFPKERSSFTRTLVRRGASLGANCTVVCGVTIGQHAFIGAGAVVTKDVPDYALIVGVPGKQAGWVCVCGKLLDRFETEAACSCGREYRLEDQCLVRTKGEG